MYQTFLYPLYLSVMYKIIRDFYAESGYLVRSIAIMIIASDGKVIR